jgi:hypothetical protein
MRMAGPRAGRSDSFIKVLAKRGLQNALVARIVGWVEGDGLWWFSSFVFHMVLVCSLAFTGSKVVERIVNEAPSFEQVSYPSPTDVPQNVEPFEVGTTPEDPSELSVDTLTLEPPGQMIPAEKSYDDKSAVPDVPDTNAGGGMAAASNEPNLGGLGGFDVKSLGPGPAIRGKGGVGIGVGSGTRPGTGGDEFGFAGRNAARRKAMLGSGGGTKQSERAVAAALNWLARHQMPDGSWSIRSFNSRCKGATCTGPGMLDFTSAGTAFGLLPFLAAGQTPDSRGPYRKNVQAGIAWLIHNQKPNGDLRTNGNMYAHGLAAIALCECYGMTGNKLVGRAAQGALNFIAESQDPGGGGWRYDPRERGDTSVVGWQVMALKSGQMAYLKVDAAVLEKAKTFLASASFGPSHGLFRYLPEDALPRITTTAVGLLCEQYMHMRRDDPAMLEGTGHLMQHLPDPDGPDGHNLYYWYYATQVMHNIPGPDWDTWNRKMRHVLIDSQVKDGCAAGSWDPQPVPGDHKSLRNDAWGAHGGRLMMTSLSALTLEVYYRYLPLYKLDADEADNTASGDKQADQAKPGSSKPAAGKAADKKPSVANPEAVKPRPADKPAAREPAEKKAK